MAIDWVLLDAGNTLLTLEYERLLAALAAEGFVTTEAEVRAAEAAARPALERAIFARWRLGGVPLTGWIEAQVWVAFWRDVLSRAGAGRDAGTERLDRLVQATLGVTRPAANWSRITPGATAALAALAGRGVRLGVISNSDGSVAAQLAALGMAERFEFILDSADVGIEKPHPEIFRRALARAGVSDPRRAIYLGDVYAIDVAGAAGAGLRPWLFDPGGVWRREEFLGVGPECRVIRSMEDLPAQVATLLRR